MQYSTQTDIFSMHTDVFVEFTFKNIQQPFTQKWIIYKLLGFLWASDILWIISEDNLQIGMSTAL